MPTRKADIYTFGGVDSRSNPANFPPERSLRCLNFSPSLGGNLRLRSGYTVPMQANADTVGATTIHSLIYYEQFSSDAIGPQYILYGKGSSVLNLTLDSGASAEIATMPSANPWGHFRATNRIHIGDGVAVSEYGFDFGFQNWDGSTWRPTGIPTISTVGTVALTTSTAGSFAPTTLTGYQFWAAWYNPITQHMGNATVMGSPVTLAATESAVLLTGIAVPPDPEWVTAIGMTNDGGQVPYWLMNSSGVHIVVANGLTMGTVYDGTVDSLSELPVRNYVPPPFDKFARVGTRIFANLSGSPYIYYSNDVSDVTNANYVGNPEESWPPDQAEAFPTGELPTALHGGQFEGWFFSKQNLAIWSTLLQAQGANPWRGPWPGGCAGQRAFVETPYGKYWVSGQKQLCTFMEDGVIPVSEEYEASLLAQIADENISQIEVGYLLDPPNRIDEIVIKGTDSDGNPVIVVHDFLLKDERGPFGQGHNYQYTGMTLWSFVGSAYTPRQNAYDTTGKMRLWCGTVEGMIAQIEDNSNSDNGSNYTGDYVTILNLGLDRPGLAEFEYQGDPNLVVSYTRDYSMPLDGLTVCRKSLLSGETSRWGCAMEGEAHWIYMRLQLTSHPADGNFEMTDPPNVPLPIYGTVNEGVLKLGRTRPEGR